MKLTNTIILKIGITLIAFICISISTFSKDAPIKAGTWKGYLKLNDSITLPFTFQIKSPLSFEFMDGDESISTTEIVFDDKDSVFITIPMVNSQFRIKITGDSIMTGTWINLAKKTKNKIPFSANYHESKSIPFPFTKAKPLTERYKVIFNPGTKDQYLSIGTFTSENGITKGTFATETGDYRYLEGNYNNENFVVSSFDGSYARVFTATKRNDSLLNGQLYSGVSGHENWFGFKNDTFELRNPDSLTYLKPGYTTIDFSYKNLEGKNVSLKDPKYKNHVVIIQLMGTWCPNCLDETKFLAKFYDKYNPKGLEVIGLAFERSTDFNQSASAVQRIKTRYNAKYEFLITEKLGSTKDAAAALPMLNTVMAFPTTIYIDKKGVVRKIYTGFYGPATGDAYTQYVDETTRFIEKLLKE